MKKHILFSLKKPKIFRQISGTVSIGISQPPYSEEFLVKFKYDATR